MLYSEGILPLANKKNAHNKGSNGNHMKRELRAHSFKFFGLLSSTIHLHIRICHVSLVIWLHFVLCAHSGRGFIQLVAFVLYRLFHLFVSNSTSLVRLLLSFRFFYARISSSPLVTVAI